MQRKSKTRERILLAAKKLFSIKGFDGVSMEEIANEAGVKKALIYYYFPSKEDLFFEVWQRSIDEMEHAVLKPIQNEGPFMAKLKKLLRSYIDFVRSRRETLQLIERERINIESRQSTLWEKLGERYSEFVERIAQLVKEGKLAAELASDLDETVTAQFIVGSLSSVDKNQLEEVANLILKSLTKKE
ncbi:MAG: hypothetical protein PWP37_1585 [Thermotogota bacterium]|nr:hypothetical protein [Thermotogota bacterium]MDK2865393.1 hypothetical protein [Thermotogota bacterium]HCZ05551.1 TetR/AcrR family transcriptional regulator [Thermotogota bacterium]